MRGSFQSEIKQSKVTENFEYFAMHLDRVSLLIEQLRSYAS
jgi:hypothetical protein